MHPDMPAEASPNTGSIESCPGQKVACVFERAMKGALQNAFPQLRRPCSGLLHGIWLRGTQLHGSGVKWLKK